MPTVFCSRLREPNAFGSKRVKEAGAKTRVRGNALDVFGGGKKASGRVETARVREVPKKAKSKQEQKQQQPKSSPSLGTQAKGARQPRRWYSRVLVRVEVMCMCPACLSRLRLGRKRAVALVWLWTKTTHV